MSYSHGRKKKEKVNLADERRIFFSNFCRIFSHFFALDVITYFYKWLTSLYWKSYLYIRTSVVYSFIYFFCATYMFVFFFSWVFQYTLKVIKLETEAHGLSRSLFNRTLTLLKFYQKFFFYTCEVKSKYQSVGFQFQSIQRSLQAI